MCHVRARSDRWRQWDRNPRQACVSRRAARRCVADPPHMRGTTERNFTGSYRQDYGSAEFGDIACDCTRQKGLHVFMDCSSSRSYVTANRSGTANWFTFSSPTCPITRCRVSATASATSAKSGTFRANEAGRRRVCPLKRVYTTPTSPAAPVLSAVQERTFAVVTSVECQSLPIESRHGPS